MWIVKNRGTSILAVIKSTKNLNSFFKKIPESLHSTQSTVMQYPSKYPFYIVKFKKEGKWEFESFSKEKTQEELTTQYKEGEVFKITKGLTPKKAGEDVLLKLKSKKFKEAV